MEIEMTDFDFINTAFEWYQQHTDHVDRLMKTEVNSLVPYFPPSREDKNHPELWKPGHWRWFFENYNMK